MFVLFLSIRVYKQVKSVKKQERGGGGRIEQWHLKELIRYEKKISGNWEQCS